jgi:hypothetical protein
MGFKIESLFRAMSKKLELSADRLAFVQARVSAEAFVRDECALAAHEFLPADRYHVLMEKMHKGKKVDLLIVPVKEGRENWDESYEFELKMAWPGGLKENVSGVKKDIDRLKSRRANAWALVLYFALDSAEGWMPYKPQKLNFEQGNQKFIEDIGHGQPYFAGDVFRFSHAGISGKDRLLAWNVYSEI